ncbi:MAG: hypothetical protein AAF411_00855 [Myxococcota bacterium]
MKAPQARPLTDYGGFALDQYEIAAEIEGETRIEALDIVGHEPTFAAYDGYRPIHRGPGNGVEYVPARVGVGVGGGGSGGGGGEVCFANPGEITTSTQDMTLELVGVAV